MRKYFGTDGIRGKVGQSPITPEFVLKLAYAAGKTLVHQANTRSKKRPAVLIGKDTRISGYMLESALEAGFIAAGVDTILCGVLPTPGVAYLTRALRLQAGVVISASHNPYYDNGIKFFDANGNKLSDEIELEIESMLQEDLVCVEAKDLGKAKRLDDAIGRYIEFCKSTFPNDLNLNGTKLLLDCANGAAYKIAPSVFHELGASVLTINNTPDGFNINEKCGATHIENLQESMKKHKGYIGLSFDGDADRIQIIDEQGKIYNGDELLYILAMYQKSMGVDIKGVVGTVMTNAGIENALQDNGLELVRAKVGDRYVLEQLQANNWQYGGESSGHLLCLDKHTTGDAIIASLQILAALQKQNITLNQAILNVKLYSQVLINLEISKDFSLDDADEDLIKKIDNISQNLEETKQGRVLIRASGTEAKLRIMVEAKTLDLANEKANEIADLITNYINK